MSLNESAEENIYLNCCCCFDDGNLFDMTEPHEHNEKMEIYSEMITECFGIEMGIEREKPYNNFYMLCQNCVDHLRDSLKFRNQIQNARSRFRDLLKNVAYNNKHSDLNTTNKLCEDDTIYSNIKQELITENNNCSLITSTESKPNHSMENENKIFDKTFMKNNTKIANLTMANGPQRVTPKSKIKKKNTVKLGSIEKQKQKNENVTLLKKKSHYHIDKNNLICEICNESFVRLHNFKIHMAVHFPNYICHICSKTFMKKNNLNCHLRRHREKEITHNCKICNKSIKGKDELYRHMKLHDNAYINKCPHCTERFKYYFQRNIHIVKVHKDKTRIYKCDFCTKGFNVKCHLTTHVKEVHLKLKKYVCDLCGKTFRYEPELTAHMSRHTGVKNFHCDVCKRSYSSKKAIRYHMKRHMTI